MVKLSCTSYSYHRAFAARKFTLLEWITFCGQTLCLEGVEIESGHFAATTPAALKEIKKALVDQHLTLACVTAYNDFGYELVAQNERELDAVKRWIDIALQLGSPLLRIFAGWPHGDRETCWAIMVEYVQRATAYAEEQGVTLVIENHNHNGFLRTSADVKRLFDAIRSPWLRLNLDTGNYLDGLPSIERTAPLALHVHAKLLHLDEEGREVHIDHARVIEILRRINYRGFVSVEYEGEEEEETAVPRGIRYLRGLLASLYTG
ncbi:MAG: sugar phosphate isomerase/epimerase [Nitrospinota bacterium]|nr:MAG: sugar phosphate isomerase/epimerase [Nitrospinota bacterium]